MSLATRDGRLAEWMKGVIITGSFSFAAARLNISVLVGGAHYVWLRFWR